MDNRWIIVAVAAFVCANIAKKLKIPAPYMLGALVAGAICSMTIQFDKLPSSFNFIVQSMCGGMVGLSIQRKDIKTFQLMIKPIVILCFCILAMSLFMGAILYFVFDFDIRTALLSCTPGGIVEMSLLSMNCDADVITVTTLHTVRMVGVLFSFPLIASQLKKKSDVPIKKAETVNKCKLSEMSLFILFATLAGFVGKISGIAGGVISITMIIIAGINLFVVPLKYASWFKKMIQLMAGVLVGSNVTMESVSKLSELFIPAVILLILYFTFASFIAKLLCKVSNLDFITAFFASAPASASDMALIAGEFGCDMSKVAIMQVCRLIVVLLVIPNLLYFLT